MTTSGTPHSVPPHAVPIERGSPERFGFEWGEYAELRAEYEEQFRLWSSFLATQDWQGLHFIDVGCGMGRNSYWPMSYGAKSGVAIDVDPRSLESARKTLAKFPTMQVMSASAYEIPFENTFDVCFSIGVIHHLEHPRQALAQMVKAAKPGGRVLIWVYGKENNRLLVSVLNPLRKALFSRLPISWVHHLSLYPTLLLSLLLKCGVGRTDYMKLIRKFPFRHLRSIVFDQMLPKIAFYWSEAEVRELMESAGLKNVELRWTNQMSWTAIGTKSNGVG